jgi:hypothetical protein
MSEAIYIKVLSTVICIFFTGLGIAAISQPNSLKEIVGEALFTVAIFFLLGWAILGFWLFI